MANTLLRRQEIGAQKRERTRRRLLDAAARVVAVMGEGKANIDDYINAAGVARGTFYNYYATRDELLDDLWTSVGRDPFLEIQDACRAIADPAERLSAETRLVLARAREQRAWGWLVYALSVDQETVNADLLQYPRPDLAIGRREGHFQFDDLAAASDLVVGAVRAALRAILQEGRPAGYDDAIALMILTALGVEPQSARNIVAARLPHLSNRS